MRVKMANAEVPASEESSRSIGKRVRRERSAEEDSFDSRFFLSKPVTSDDSALELGREFSTEGEVRVEALKTGLTYYSVQEWRPVADFAGRNPQLKRESVARKAASNAEE